MLNVKNVSVFDTFTPETFGSEQIYFDQILEFSNRHLNRITSDLHRISLSLRFHSPAVQMMRKMAMDTQMTRECSIFVDIHGSYSCDVNDIENLLITATNRPKTLLLPFDHHYLGSNISQTVTVILYADFGNQNEFRPFHEKLSSLAETGQIDYILRHYVKSLVDKRKVRLSGYGVELQIKSTEYKAKDDSAIKDDQYDETFDNEKSKNEDTQGFLFGNLKELYPELTSELNEYRTYLIDSADVMAPLKAWQMQDLSLQCAYRAFSAPIDDVLNVLLDLSQNFPSRARMLSKVKIDPAFRDAHKSNQDEFRSSHNIENGDSSFFINNIQQSLDTTDLYVLLTVLLNEGQMMERLHLVGLKKPHIRQLLTSELNIQTINYILDFRDEAILWLNNIEKDSEYDHWPRSLFDILRNNFFGGLKTVRKNLYNLILIIDPSSSEASYDLLKHIESYLVHQLPIRIGLLFVTTGTDNDDFGRALYRSFRYVVDQSGAVKALSFINDVYKTKQQTAEDIKQLFKKTIKFSGNIDLIFGDDSKYDNGRQEMNNYFERSGLNSVPQVLFNGNPLSHDELLPTAFEDVITTRMLRMQFDIQQQVYHGQLNDQMDMIEMLNNKPNVVKRLNQRIFAPILSSYVDLSFLHGNALNLYDLETFLKLSVREQAASIMAHTYYLGKRDELGQPLYPITLWLACDLDRLDGRLLFTNALIYLKSNTHARLGLLASFSSESEPGSHPITKAVYTAIRMLSPPIARNFIMKLLKETTIQDLMEKRKTWDDIGVSGLSGSVLEKEISSFNNSIFQSHMVFLEKGLNLPKGSRSVIVNGRILGPLRENEIFTEEDFVLLDKHMSETINNKLVRTVTNLQLFDDPSVLSDLLMRISSIIGQSDKNVVRKQPPQVQSMKASVHLPASNDDEPSFLVEVVVDPASRDGQRLISLIVALKQSINIDLTIHFNCKLQLSDMPLKSYYRYVFDQQQQRPSAIFRDLPESPILTLGMITPESWMVEAVMSPYDLDNIHLQEVPLGVNANFELEYLLIEGQCYDETQNYPRGLQLTLGTNSTPNIFDTIVMANLGYFQLKAYPGVWVLNLREGRSSELYTITAHDNTDSSTRTTQPVIVGIRSFDARWIKIYVTRTTGTENEKLLEDSDDSPSSGGSIWDSFSFGSSVTTAGKSTKIDDIDDQDTLNIFSVASGHLYERLLRIMMLSVLKNTKKHVKFWFLKNFLSPAFTSFLPYYAKTYNFDYELVHYKWPKWLTVQPTEKQRVIWGYKILFLDVLFPLNLKKVIFVDADQVVRADLAELRDLDLHGAPYGYTPFCESRKEMDGYRFWKTGYWSTHLGHRRYHISALYVIDLKKFRKIAAGDRLRGQYYGLSQDPNSLSNLDQDLPNNMIHQVNIYSLPEEWLWCETWCDDNSKKKAKTIDLCNNPMTKEPKLNAATRIISEWDSYDQEIKSTMSKWELEGKPNLIDTRLRHIVDGDDSLRTATTVSNTEESIPNIHDGTEL
ncbi:unnamed protein product [Didymodactylos carnosus]|uniref:UDP-glucose:glycoprotein glucosyltransferase n=1 Tax=Didymodactylos carnosus TaxID=1234261 RepID=A0A814AZH7_9BILA|nr:unnamed protein product [Didymodactylos carnosus]CAF0919859.1 unnamed protein product [Didymodactylos carnosus]CAF3540534.1 unnamed protein product [Didymodactylos carnosus]CAF3699315.1 unnamed protein product [Didymodactylos carnosus]